MTLQIKENLIHIWRDSIGGEWTIVGRKIVEVSYHPDWEAKTELLIGIHKKGETLLGFRLLVLSVDAPYKQDIYYDAIMFSIADIFRQLLWESPPTSPTDLELDSCLLGCENK